MGAENLYSGFETIRRNNRTIYVNRAFRNHSLEQALLGGERQLQQQFELSRFESSKFARLYKFTARFGGVDRRVYFKQYIDRSAWDFIKHIFRRSRARRAFEASLMLAERGFQAPVVIAMGGCGSAFIKLENFIVTLEVEGAKPIYQFIADKPEQLTKEQRRRQRSLIRTFGRIVGRMHAGGIFHGDLRLGNVLARQNGGNWQFFFLDNERTRKFRQLPRCLRLKNLVQVNMYRTEGLTNTDRMRFFKAYLEENQEIEDNWKSWGAKLSLRTNLRLGRSKSIS